MKTSIKALVGALVLGLTTTGFAQAQSSQESRIAALEKEVQRLRAANGESWLNTRRANEIRTLVHEVLSDAETRASLAEGGMTAGWSNGSFFLGSEDGQFLMKVGGGVQIRFLFNDRDNEPETKEGFHIPRAKVSLTGHLHSKKFTYGVSWDFSSGTPGSTQGTARLENAWAAYDFADGWNIKGGQFKAMFLREDIISYAHQQASERSLANDIFTLDYVQGIQISYTADKYRVFATIHDGAYSANAGSEVPAADAVDIAVGGRIEVLIAGTWGQFDDFAAWSGAATGLLVGAAIDYVSLAGEGQSAAGINNVVRYTVDAQAEIPSMMGLNIFAAFMGASTDAVTGSDIDPWAVVVQAGVFIVPDKVDIFIRWEHIDSDGTTGPDDEVDIVTIGVNYYIKKHAAKFTVDIVWNLDTASLSLPTGLATGPLETGLRGSTDDDEYAIRAQFQFLF